MFNGDVFELWEARFKIFIQIFDFELQGTIIYSTFIPTHYTNGEVVDKPNCFQTIEENRKFEIDLKNKNFLDISLDDNQLFYVHNCNFAKEMWNTPEMIYGISPNIELQRMNTRGEKYECFLHKCF